MAELEHVVKNIFLLKLPKGTALSYQGAETGFVPYCFS